MPPVSTTVNATPRQSESARIRSLVVPGMSEVTALRSPTRRLNNVDFPTFGLPTRATIGLRITTYPFSQVVSLYHASPDKSLHRFDQFFRPERLEQHRIAVINHDRLAAPVDHPRGQCNDGDLF